MIERIVLDIDGVLANCLGGVKTFHNKIYPNHPHNPDAQTDQMPWDIGPVFEMSNNAIWKPLGYEFWRDLEPLPWCFEVVRLLSDLVGEENICLLTSPIETAGCIDGKRDWIRKHLPQFRKRFLVGPAKEFAASPWTCLVDDNTDNVNAFKKAGGLAFLFPAPWNRRFKEHQLPALRRWLDALKVIGESC